MIVILGFSGYEPLLWFMILQGTFLRSIHFMTGAKGQTCEHCTTHEDIDERFYIFYIDKWNSKIG